VLLRLSRHRLDEQAQDSRHLDLLLEALRRHGRDREIAAIAG
jgi:hypothetical protein